MDTENKWSGLLVSCKFEYFITLKKGLVFIRNNLFLIISSDDYHFSITNIQACVLNILQDK